MPRVGGTSLTERQKLEFALRTPFEVKVYFQVVNGRDRKIKKVYHKEKYESFAYDVFKEALKKEHLEFVLTGFRNGELRITEEGEKHLETLLK